MSNPVCFGDLLYIDLDNSILFSSGFFDSGLYFVSKENLCIKSFRQGLFKICPSFSYKETGDSENLSNQLDLLKRLNPENDLGAKQIAEDINQEKKNLELTEVKLESLNEKIFNESKGKPLHYGDKIQLLHIESQNYVAISKTFSKIDKAMITLELSSNGSKSMYFEITPAQSYLQYGDVVEYETPLYIISTRNNFAMRKGKPVDLSKIRSEVNPEKNTLTRSPEFFPPIQTRRPEPLYENKELCNAGVKLSDNFYPSTLRKYTTQETYDIANQNNSFKNGDYIRISNDRSYLTVFPGKTPGECLVSCQAIIPTEYNYNYAYSLFQLFKQPSNASALAEGFIIENDSKREKKTKYLIRHVATGLYLSNDKGTLRLVKKDDLKDLPGIYLYVKNLSQNALENSYLDKGSVLRLIFSLPAQGEEEQKSQWSLTLENDQPIPLKPDLSTTFYNGYKLQDDYLNKWIRPERNNVVVQEKNNDETTSFRFTTVDEFEIASFNMVESFANRVTKFIDFLFDFTVGDKYKIRDINEKFKALTKACKDFKKQLFSSGDRSGEVTTTLPNPVRQTLMREFRIFDLFYRIYYIFARDTTFMNKFLELQKKEQENTKIRLAEIRKKLEELKKELGEDAVKNFEKQEGGGGDDGEGDGEGGDDEEAPAGPKAPTTNEDEQINFRELNRLFGTIRDLIVHSFVKNDLNHLYANQFTRVCLHSLCNNHLGVYNVAPYHDKVAMMGIMLSLCKQCLWDSDMDSLDQLTQFQADIFRSLDEQASYHSIFLKLLTHIANSQAPNFKNTVRDKFIFEYMKQGVNMKHVFPALVDTTEGQVNIEFNRKGNNERKFFLSISELDEKNIDKITYMDWDTERIPILTDYFMCSLELVAALAQKESSTYDLAIVCYYKFHTLEKTIRVLEQTTNRGIRIALADIMANLHKDYFDRPIPKIPNQIQVLDETKSLDKYMTDISSYIDKSIETAVSKTEWEYIRNQDAESIVKELKGVVTQGHEEEEFLKMLRNPIGFDAILGEGRIILETIRKAVTQPGDLSLVFLNLCYDTVVRFIHFTQMPENQAAIEKEKPIYYDFIHQVLNVLGLVDRKLVTIAASDIVGTLKAKNVLTNKANAALSADKTKKKKKKQVRPEENLGEPKTNPSQQQDQLSIILNEQVNVWKTQERFSQIDDGNNISPSTQKNYKKEAVIQYLFEIILLKEPFLTSAAIQQLRYMTAFESKIYKELSRLILIYDEKTIKKTYRVVEITTRLTEIAREINFCSENKIRIDKEVYESLIQETLDMLWDLFHMIYNVDKHFRYPEHGSEPKDRFRKLYEACKSSEADISFKINEEAIVGVFQKVLAILETHKALLITLEWVMEVKKGWGPEYMRQIHCIRLILNMMSIFVYKNPENQNSVSGLGLNIRLFYNPNLIAQSTDSLVIFAEMLRDNKRLLKFPQKYLYDITLLNYVDTLKKKSITNDEKDSSLSSCISSLHFLIRAAIPREAFNGVKILKKLLDQAAEVEKFTSLSIQDKWDNPKIQPFCFYSQLELMQATLDVVSYFSNDIKLLNEMQLWLPFTKWIGFFSHKNYLAQYDLKNSVAKTIVSAYYKQEKKGKFVQEFAECKILISYILNEIAFFRQSCEKRKGKPDSARLKTLLEVPNFLNKHEDFKKIISSYDILRNTEFSHQMIRIYLEDYSLETLQRNYIYDGCLELLFAIAINESALCSRLGDRTSPKFQKIIDIILEIIEDLLESDDRVNDFPYVMVEDFLTQISADKNYLTHISQINDLNKKLHDLVKMKGTSMETLQTMKTKKNAKALEFYHIEIKKKLKSRTQFKENNYWALAKQLGNNKLYKKIIREFLNYLKKDGEKTEYNEAIFIIKLLRNNLQRENKEEGNLQFYFWKEINIMEIKKMKTTQSAYKELGLTELIFKFLGIKDDKILLETIILSQGYLYGGNKEIQDDFHDKFEKDLENNIISVLSKKLSKTLKRFNVVETSKLKHLYTQTSKSVFDYMNGKTSKDQIVQVELEHHALQHIDPEYLEDATLDDENQFLVAISFLLQTLVEKQHAALQRFLRVQKTGDQLLPKQFDFLVYLRQSINSYYKIFRESNLEIGESLLNGILNMIQGENIDSVKALLHKTFIYDLCRMITDFNGRFHTIPRGFGLEPLGPSFRKFKGLIYSLLKSMLESNDPKVAETLRAHLDMLGLLEALEQIGLKFLEIKGLKKNSKPEKVIYSLTKGDAVGLIGNAIDIYIVFRYIWTNNTEFNENINSFINHLCKKDGERKDFIYHFIFDILKSLVGSVELAVDKIEGGILRIWFPIITICHYLSEDYKKSFLATVERSNTHTKISELMDESEEFMIEMHNEYRSRKRFLGINFKSFYRYIRWISNLLSLIVNFINLLSYKYENGDTEQSDRDARVGLGLNILLSIFAAFLVVLWVVFKRQAHLNFEWESFVDANVKSRGFLNPTIRRKCERGAYDTLEEQECIDILELEGPNSDEFDELKREPSAYNYVKKMYIRKEIIFSFRSNALIWHLIYFGLCIGSLFHPLVACFQLFDMAVQSPTVVAIATAIGANPKQFGWTLMILGTSTTVFTFIGFFFLNNKLIIDDYRICETMWECMLNNFNYGIRVDEGIAGDTEITYYTGGNFGEFFVKIIFDMGYFVILLIILRDLLFGMIIDSFGELRDEKNKRDDDELNVCFICGINRSSYERYANFDNHMIDDHNVWNYIYYYTYCFEKYKNSKNELTDIENFVIEKTNIKDFGWMPIGKSLTLMRCTENDVMNSEDNLSKLEEKIDEAKSTVMEQVNSLKKKQDFVKNGFTKIVNMLRR